MDAQEKTEKRWDDYLKGKDFTHDMNRFRQYLKLVFLDGYHLGKVDGYSQGYVDATKIESKPGEML